MSMFIAAYVPVLQASRHGDRCRLPLPSPESAHGAWRNNYVQHEGRWEEDIVIVLLHRKEGRKNGAIPHTMRHAC